MRFSLKTKISTPIYDETLDFYKTLFGMSVVEEWDSPDDKGVILSFADGRDEAFIEIYYSSETHDFSGLSLQFKVEDLDSFCSTLPDELEKRGPVPRTWGSRYLYLKDPSGVSVIVYEGGN
ncbi:MAG: VOC family protein [Pyrinomonadaceae bacterium]|nr:VOC family protein [Pyrinomonadaceae bacterium]